ncbi:MAG: hypothetical protein LBS85_07690, partial [Clostridiales Family XIII bacterium]|nr:hypothetical protein [Clostridiales Family XIII bacterium]
MGGNRAYRDSIFTSYFKDEGRLLEMYNAISGKNYGQDTEVRINTLENVLFRDRINDLSFLLGEKLIVLI